MSEKKFVDKYDILADVVRALRDDTMDVLVETVGARKIGYASVVREEKPQVPMPREDISVTGVSKNRMYADSIKIGKDILIKRMRRPFTHVKADKNEYDVDNGWYWVVRTQSGEAMFEANDKDFLVAWDWALQKYDRPNGHNYGNHVFYNEKLRKVYAGPGKLKSSDRRSKYQKAIDQLNGLGVDPQKLAEYILEKQKQNN
ncbi:MAG: hypothetical protein E7011_04825 [Alphaproteobacteria bacterium]|nr:hypothetical protein [Alphaproteobacteria bacterium]